MATRRNWPVNPSKALGWLLDENFAREGTLTAQDRQYLARIIESLYHTHEAGGTESVVSSARFVASDFDIPLGGGASPSSWTKVSGGSEFDAPFGSPRVTLPRTGIVSLSAWVPFRADGAAGSVALGDRIFMWLQPGSQQPQYLDVARLTSYPFTPDVYMQDSAVAPVTAATPTTLTVFLPTALDSAGAEKVVRCGVSLEMTAMY